MNIPDLIYVLQILRHYPNSCRVYTYEDSELEHDHYVPMTHMSYTRISFSAFIFIKVNQLNGL